MSPDTALRRAASGLQTTDAEADAHNSGLDGLPPQFEELQLEELDRLAASPGAHVSPEVVLELAQALAAAPLGANTARRAGSSKALAWLSVQPRLASAAATPATIRALAEAVAAAGRAAAAAPPWETCTDAPAAVCPRCHPHGPHVTLAKHAALLGGALMGRKLPDPELFVVVLQVRGAASEPRPIAACLSDGRLSIRTDKHRVHRSSEAQPLT
jgi:hypothetical protein